MSKKNSIQDVKELFCKEQALLDSESIYIDNKAVTLKYICKYGENHITSLSNWKRGRRCTCGKKQDHNLIYYTRAKELLLKYGAELKTSLEEYVDVITPLNFINCSGESQNISLNNLNLCDRFENIKDEVASLVKKNYKQQEISEKFNTTQTIISMCLRLWGSNNSNSNRFIEIQIPKEDLYEMYWKHKCHPKFIAEKYNCSITTVIRNMQEYGIPLRTKSEARLGELNPIFNVGHSEEAKEKMSLAFLEGRNRGYSGNWGTLSTYTSPNQGKVLMRSSWEVRVADYLSSNQEIWFYEYEVFKLTDCISYQPDFYLPNRNIYLEVKGRTLEEDLHKVNKFKAVGFNCIVLTRQILEKIGLINSSGKIVYNKEVLPLDLLIERYL